MKGILFHSPQTENDKKQYFFLFYDCINQYLSFKQYSYQQEKTEKHENCVKETSEIRHGTVTYDGCVTEDYDLCEACEAKGTHPFL